MTADEALAIAKIVLDHKRLNNIQEIVFRQSWEGQSYKDIAGSSGYGMGYVKDAGSQLWQLLSKGFGEKVTKNNLQGVIKQYQQQATKVRLPTDSAQETEQAIACSTSHPPRPDQILPPRNHSV